MYNKTRTKNSHRLKANELDSLFICLQSMVLYDYFLFYFVVHSLFVFNFPCSNSLPVYTSLYIFFKNYFLPILLRGDIPQG